MIHAARKLALESILIAVVALADLIVTIWLVGAKHAYEGNPIMRYYLEHGVVLFVIVKILLTAMPILILEWARRHRPAFVRTLSRLALVGYVGLYAVMFVKVNVPTLVAHSQQPTSYLWAELKVPNAEEVGTTGPLLVGKVRLVPNSVRTD